MAYFPVVVDFTNGPPIGGPSGDEFISKDVGFQAQAVGVDNYTAYWLYFPDADAYVPPFWGGVVLPLGHTSDYAYGRVLSPLANPQAPTDPSYRVHTVWTDQPQPFNAGQVIAGFGGSPFSVSLPTSFDTLLQTTVVVVSSVATLLPAVNLVGRSAVMLQSAPDNTFTTYIGGAAVTADETNTGGVQLLPGMSISIDADANVLIYGICKSTQSTHIIVAEAY